jgi:HAD superfamily hydrolase (TIGR01549 family)
MGNLRAAFFDLGGTLIPKACEVEGNLATLAAAKGRFGLPGTPETLVDRFWDVLRPVFPAQAKRWSPIRDVLMDALDPFLAPFGRTPTLEDREWFWEVWLRSHVGAVRPAPYAREVVDNLRRAGLHVGLLSDVDDDFLVPALRRLAMADAFDSVTTSGREGVGKPNRRLFEVALARADTVPALAVYVGDSAERDVGGAKAVGMYAVFLGPAEEAAAADEAAADLRAAEAAILRLAGGKG